MGSKANRKTIIDGQRQGKNDGAEIGRTGIATGMGDAAGHARKLHQGGPAKVWPGQARPGPLRLPMAPTLDDSVRRRLFAQASEHASKRTILSTKYLQGFTPYLALTERRSSEGLIRKNTPYASYPVLTYLTLCTAIGRASCGCAWLRPSPQIYTSYWPCLLSSTRPAPVGSLFRKREMAAYGLGSTNKSSVRSEKCSVITAKTTAVNTT